MTNLIPKTVDVQHLQRRKLDLVLAYEYDWLVRHVHGEYTGQAEAEMIEYSRQGVYLCEDIWLHIVDRTWPTMFEVDMQLGLWKQEIFARYNASAEGREQHRLDCERARAEWIDSAPQSKCACAHAWLLETPPCPVLIRMEQYKQASVGRAIDGDDMMGLNDSVFPWLRRHDHHDNTELHALASMSTLEEGGTYLLLERIRALLEQGGGGRGGGGKARRL